MLVTLLLTVLAATRVLPTLDLDLWALYSRGNPGSFYETKYERYGDRAHNVELAAASINSSILWKDKIWSFNTMVGARTGERGYRMAPALAFGEVIEEVGGGVCQVSSTLFAAALLAGINIIERHSHARVSAYIPMGYDATVNFPEDCQDDDLDPRFCFDLRLSNPYPFPVTIHTEATYGGLMVWLEGEGPFADVHTTWRPQTSTPFNKRWVRKYRAGHKPKRKQSGANGLEGVLLIDVDWPVPFGASSSRYERRTMLSTYKPVDEVWWVGMDWGRNKNPWKEP